MRGKTCRVSVGAAKPEQRRCGAGGTAKEERSGKGERTGRSEGGDGGKPRGFHRPAPRPLLTLQVLLRRAEPRHGGVELGTRSARRSVRLRAAVTAAPLPLGAAALPPSANGRGGGGQGEAERRHDGGVGAVGGAVSPPASPPGRRCRGRCERLRAAAGSRKGRRGSSRRGASGCAGVSNGNVSDRRRTGAGIRTDPGSSQTGGTEPTGGD